MQGKVAKTRTKKHWLGSLCCELSHSTSKPGFHHKRKREEVLAGFATHGKALFLRERNNGRTNWEK